jgi:endonuclease IV
MLGLHISKNMTIGDKKYKTTEGVVKAEILSLGLSAFSLFILGPQSYNAVSMDHESIRKYCSKNNVDVWPHGSYLTAGIWNVTRDNLDTGKSQAALKSIIDHIDIADKLGSKGVVVHLPRHNMETIVNTMHILSENIKNDDRTAFTIEMPASRPDEKLTYETSDKINLFVKTLMADSEITINWNLCVDTCHLWAGGVNMKKFITWKNTLSRDTRDKIKLIHLNGAEAKNYGTGKDGHRIPLSRSDAIWGPLISDESRESIEALSVSEQRNKNLCIMLSYSDRERIQKSSLASIVKFAKMRKIAMIMEIKVEDFCNTKIDIDVLNWLLTL